MQNKFKIFSIALLLMANVGATASASIDENASNVVTCPDPAIFDQMCKNFRDGDYPEVDGKIGPWHLIVNCEIYDKGFHAMDREIPHPIPPFHEAMIRVYVNSDRVAACSYGPLIDGIFTPGAWIPREDGKIKSATIVEKEKGKDWAEIQGGGNICGPAYSPDKTQLHHCKFILNK